MKGISIPPQTGIAIAQHRNRWGDGIKLHRDGRALNVTSTQNHVTRLQRIVGLFTQMAMNIGDHANKHVQLLRFDGNESTLPGRDEKKAGRSSAFYKTSGFRQSFGRTPVTTSIAACMARVRSSMPDSSDQYATCGLSTV